MDFEEKFTHISQDTLTALADQQNMPSLSNVISGQEENFILVGIRPELNLEEFMIIYAGNHNSEIRGFSFLNSRVSQERDLNTFKFSRQIELYFPALNSLSVFNEIQELVRSNFEDHGIEFIPERIGDFNPNLKDILKNKFDLGSLIIIDIGKFYQSYFKSDFLVDDIKGKQKLYLSYYYDIDKFEIGSLSNDLFSLTPDSHSSEFRNTRNTILVAAWLTNSETIEYIYRIFEDKMVSDKMFDLRSDDIEILINTMDNNKRIIIR